MKTTKNELACRDGEILIYQAQNGQTKLEVRLEGETLWLSQAGLAELYQTTRQNITIYIQNIYEENELSDEATCKDVLQVQTEGARQINRRDLRQAGACPITYQ